MYKAKAEFNLNKNKIQSAVYIVQKKINEEKINIRNG